MVAHPPFPRVTLRLLAMTLAIAIALLGTLHAMPNSAQAAGSSTTLTIGWSQDSTNLDPPATISNPNTWVEFNIYDQLLRVGNDGKTLKPDLATSWTVSNGAKVYTFHLRKGVTFTNGQKLTASDVAFALKRAAGAKSAWSFIYAAIKSVTAPNASTVRVTLKHPWGPFLSDVSLFAGGVYPKSYFLKVGEKG